MLDLHVVSTEINKAYGFKQSCTNKKNLNTFYLPLLVYKAKEERVVLLSQLKAYNQVCRPVSTLKKKRFV